MSDLDRLFSEYLATFEAGDAPPDPRHFLDRASPDERPVLARLIWAIVGRVHRRLVPQVITSKVATG